MQRRKFLIAAGSLAAGSAAAMGTGAFSSRAERSMNVDVVGSENAYLGVDPNTDSEYITASSPMAIDLAGESDEEGSGLLEMSDTVIRPAFRLMNQSDETLYVEINNPLSNNDMSTSGSDQAPAGLDVQFLSAPSLPLSDYNDTGIALIGRGSGTNSNPLGADFDDIGSNGYYFHEGGDKSDRTTLQESRSKSKSGALEISPGESFPVVFRVVTREVNVEVPDVDFRIEAYDSTGPLTYDTVSWASE